MHAFLILAEDPDAHIRAILDKFSAKRLDAIVHTIEQSRDLVKQTNLHFDKKTAIVLSDFSQATPEAQNALLKLIEEPQENLLFILLSPNGEGILPTILSRVEIIQDKSRSKKGELDDSFFALSIGEKLTKTTKIKSREEALLFVESLLESAHTLLLQQKIPSESITAIAKTQNNLKRNGNVQLQLTHMITQL